MNKIAIRDIGINDRRYSISYPPVDMQLISSVSKVGIIQPLIVTGPVPHLIVTGFRRIDAALHLHWTEVPCLIEEMSEQAALLRAIHDNLRRGLSVVEKAQALERMFHFGFSMEEVFETMGLFGLQPHEKPLATLIALANTEDPLKGFIADHQLSFRNIEHILRFDPPERTAIIGILSGLHVTESYLREILQLLSLLRLKTGSLPFESLSTADGVEELRGCLRSLVNPKLAALRKELEALKGECALPPGIDIKVDPFFEKEYIDISIRIRTPENLKRAIQKLDELSDGSQVRSMLGLTKS
jgi:hypothetical protein